MEAVRFRFNVSEVEVIFPFSQILPFAASVRFAARPPVFKMSAPASWVMWPQPVPELAVVIVTLVPLFSALLIDPLLTVAVSLLPALKPPVMLPL